MYKYYSIIEKRVLFADWACAELGTSQRFSRRIEVVGNCQGVSILYIFIQDSIPDLCVLYLYGKDLQLLN